MDNGKALMLLDGAENEIRTLAVPNKELAQALVQAASAQVSYLLSNGDVIGAIDVKDKLEGIETYIRKKVQKQQADLITQNTVAAGRLRTIREIGGWLDENMGSGRWQSSPNGTLLKDVGVGRTTSHRWQRVAEIDEQDFDIWVTENIETSELTFVKLVQLWAQLFKPDHTDTPALPDNQYRCIVIDPPWPVAKIEREERPYQGVKLDYPIMEIEDIAALRIPDITVEDGCHIYLWVTQKYLPIGFELLKEWGFKYECLLTWVKPTGFTPYSWMYNTEHVLFGRMGNLPLAQMGQKLAFTAPKGKHSQKPAAFYEMVANASPEPRLEMFARVEREGFEVWGNEV